MSFANRKDAGSRLAAALTGYRGKCPVVIALPRGGVAVAAEIARALDAPLDLLFVQKIGVPFHSELAMGAIVDGPEPIIVRNENVIRQARIRDREFSAICRSQQMEIERRKRLYLGNRNTIPLAGRVVIVVDDGIATGSTVKAALKAIRNQGPQELVLAVPVAPAVSLEELERNVDALICLEAPFVFRAVGHFYDDFRQVSDAEVISALEVANQSGSA
ncbi:phosphoribosyltransferase [Rhizobium sp. LjRoot98]|uniref:phosphoribosyltransferase n=1 Tax=unclassified Rhizobium TaxID=2613769 RepID=UPI000714C69E|nr:MULTISPECIES: phosphoribosyltransferase [unclassified Rhizobium]KQV40270.1 phosphoribosyltransferase [Rhizobium sp. Root1204]KQY02632.1 phosphoribosyltransferase [Rhizobium sp. Root1334]KRB99244.1 phosphoribosyltransferase [Rhizobium sp. Root73]